MGPKGTPNHMRLSVKWEMGKEKQDAQLVFAAGFISEENQGTRKMADQEKILNLCIFL